MLLKEIEVSFYLSKLSNISEKPINLLKKKKVKLSNLQSTKNTKTSCNCGKQDLHELKFPFLAWLCSMISYELCFSALQEFASVTSPDP